MKNKFIKLIAVAILFQFIFIETQASDSVIQEQSLTSGLSLASNLKALNNYSLLNTE